MTADLIIRLNLWPWALGFGRTGKTRWIDFGPLGLGVRYEGTSDDR